MGCISCEAINIRLHPYMKRENVIVLSRSCKCLNSLPEKTRKELLKNICKSTTTFARTTDSGSLLP
jgi:hypothetical protein